MRFFINSSAAGASLRGAAARLWGAALLAMAVTAGGAEPDVDPDAAAARPAEWKTDLDEAFGLARVSLKPVLTLFTTPPCPACARLKLGPLRDDTILALLRQFECVEIDAARRGELAMRYQVRAVPAFRVLEPDGRLRDGLDGYCSSSELGAALEAFLGGVRVSAELAALAERIKSGKAGPADWAAALAAMGSPEGRSAIRPAVLTLSGVARGPLVDALTNATLAVRSGALDLLEELAGETMGFDPWANRESPASRESLDRWRDWMTGTNRDLAVYAVMTEAEFEQCLQDLIGRDPDRSARALRLLAQGGEMVVNGIVRFLESHGDLEEGAVRRIKEVQYALGIPADSGLNPAATAHRLVWGNLDVQLQTIRQLSECDMRAMPILLDLLKSPDALVRETAVETAFAAAGRFAVKPMQAHLETERDEDVVYAVLRQLGKVSTRRSQTVLERYFNHASEALAVAAIESAGKNAPDLFQARIPPLLKDPRWRVRVAALEAVKARESSNKALEEAVQACLRDSDSFVRHTAVATLVKMGAKTSVGELHRAYAANTEMRGVIVSALLAMNGDLPRNAVADLLGGDPMALLQALDGLEKVDSANRELLHRAAEGDHADAACAALRVLARSDSRSAADFAVLVNALRSGAPEQRLTVLQEYAWEAGLKEKVLSLLGSVVDPSAAEGNGAGDGSLVDALVQAFTPARSEPAPESGSGTPVAQIRGANAQAVLREAERLMGDAGAGEASRTAAMLLLCRFGHDAAFRQADKDWERLTPVEQAMVASTLSAHGPKAIPLFRRALRSRSEEVWRNALDEFTDSAGSIFAVPLVDELLASDTRLSIPVAWDAGARGLCGKKTPPVLARMKRILSEEEARPDLLVFALSILAAGEPARTNAVAFLALTDHADPYVRRAAWLAVAAADKGLFTERIEELRNDSAWVVRDTIPSWFSPPSYAKRADLYFSEDERFTGYRGLTFPSSDSRYSRYGSSAPALKPAVTGVLRALSEDDPEPWVRFRSGLVLLGHRQAVDLNRVLAAGLACRKRGDAAELLSDFLSENQSSLGASFARLLPLLRTPDGGVEGEYVTRELKKRWGLNEAENDEAPVSFAYRPRPDPEQPVMAVVGEVGPTSFRARTNPQHAVFFTTAGCKDCAAVAKMLDNLRGRHSGLQVLTYNVRTTEGIQFNEALCERFGVPSGERAVTPAVFMAHGYLIKNAITRQALMELAERSAEEPEPDEWARVTTAELGAARAAVEKRVLVYTVPMIAGLGLADGVNPCAFASMIFLIAYLRVRKRSRRELAAIGCVYVLAVFATYFALGLGLADLVTRLTVLQGAQSLVNRLLLVGLLIVAFLSARDGVRCLRGRAETMTLQLPERLKKGIHSAVREGTAYRRYVIAAGMLGVAVSVLEMACTGQGYLPTIVYMAQDPGARLHMAALLLVYNLAFVVPLAVVFVVAVQGMENARLQGWMIRHMATVKFALAALFLTLFVVFIRSGFF